MNRPQIHEYSPWGETYIKLVEGDIMEILERQATEFPGFINSMVEKADYTYAPGKWTIKEIFGHIIDTERILVYRLTCIARGEVQHLPGFEEDDYVTGAHFSDRSLLSLSHEFALLRKANLYLFQSLTEPELDRIGVASEKNVSVRALLYIVAGHIMHHVHTIKERYL